MATPTFLVGDRIECIQDKLKILNPGDKGTITWIAKAPVFTGGGLPSAIQITHEKWEEWSKKYEGVLQMGIELEDHRNVMIVWPACEIRKINYKV